mgnify:CR=1 FL=1|jgi:hypothetical protein
MDFLAAAKQTKVIKTLRSIEDKLDERGLIISATECEAPDVTIRYEHYNDEECLLIKISCKELPIEDEDGYERISDYVGSKINDLSCQWAKEVKKPLLNSYGIIVLLNGEKVY